MAHMEATVEEVRPILEEAIEKIFIEIQNRYEATTRDTEPEQEFELDDCTGRLANLICEIVNQNMGG